MRIRRPWLEMVGLVVFFVLCLIIIANVIVRVARGDSGSDNLPVLSITLNGVSLTEINENSKDIKYSGNEVNLAQGNDELSWNGVEIKGRGNFTWGDIKKPYRIKFKKVVDLLGLGKARKWVLLTNNLDDSLMRNDLGFFIANLIGSDYVPRGEFVKLRIDDEDLGVYYLMKDLSVGKNGLGLESENSIMVELDNAYCDKEEVVYWTQAGNCMVVKDQMNKDNEALVMENFLADYDALELAAVEGDYETVQQVADVRSLAEYFLVSEFLANPDAYVTSYYYYKDDLEDKIHVGPVWDLDGAFGNLNWGLGTMEDGFFDPWAKMVRKEHAYGWVYYDKINDEMIEMEPDTKISKLMYNLIEIPDFMDVVKEVYVERLEGKEDAVLDYIDERYAQIRNAAVSDAQIWKKKDFDEAIKYLKWWVEQRFKMFGAWLGGHEVIIDLNGRLN